MGFMKALINVVTGKGFNKLFDGNGALGGDYKDRQYFQDTGFTSMPREGSQGVVLKRGENYICIATADDPSNVPELQNAGDVAIYASTDYLIKISVSGEIEIKGNGNAGSIKLGDGVVDNIMKDSVISKFNNHGHVETGVALGVSSTPTFSPTPPVPPAPPSALYSSSDATTQVQAS